MAGVDDAAFRILVGADEEIGYQLDRLLRRREADALQPAAADVI